MLIGRQAELSTIAAALDSARRGDGVALCFTGAAGLGKTSLLAAAVAAASGFHCVRATGVPGEIAIGHAALADVVTPLRDLVAGLPPPQQLALETAVGWSAVSGHNDRFLVGAATISLLSLAARERPVLLLVDDLQWIDVESQSALLFAARRVGNDAVAVIVARRDGAELAGVNEFRLTGLNTTLSAALLAGRTNNAGVIDRLVADTAGNPLALLEAARGLSAAQLRGSAPLPPVLPIGPRIGAAFLSDQSALSTAARTALVIAAASSDRSAGPVVAALNSVGVAAEAGLLEAERAGLVTLTNGALSFRRPLIRAAIWEQADPDERRSAHAALAAVTQDRPAQCLRHRAEAAIGFDDALAGDLQRLAVGERSRLGYAASSALFERAAQLSADRLIAADALASAVEDAVLSGDVLRARALARDVEGTIDAPQPANARVLLALGVLEQNLGSVPKAATLLRRSAELGSGTIRLRALVELAQVGYRLGAARLLPMLPVRSRPSRTWPTRSRRCWPATPGRRRWPSPGIGSKPGHRACARSSCWNPNPRSGTIRGIW